MQSLLKINLNGGLKRLVSTLICLMMVLATFPMHTLKNTVCAEGEGEGEEKQPISITLSSADQVKNWMDEKTTPPGDLSNATKVKNAGDIEITLNGGFTVSDTANQMASSNYFFDFTDSRFAGKTITIDGGRNNTIIINSENLYFLQLKNCTVILKNITIDGGGVSRSGNFIDVLSGSGSKLEIQEQTTIQNCKSTGSGGAIYNSGQLEINDGTITNCSADAYGGGIFNSGGGTLTAVKGEITGCTAGKVDGYSQGDAIFNSGTLILPTIPQSGQPSFKTNNIGSTYEGVLNGDKVYQVVFQYKDGEDPLASLGGEHIRYYPVGSNVKIPARERDDHYTYTCVKLKYGNAEVDLSGDEFRLEESMAEGLSSGGKITFTVQYQKSIDITLNSDNFSGMLSFMTGLVEANKLGSVGGDINIKLGSGIDIDNVNEGMSGLYFFDFTNSQFAGKTITIDGTSATGNGSNYAITIKNVKVPFLLMRNCTVILRNIKIDGGGVSQSGNFIDVSGSYQGESLSYLLMDNVDIINCEGASYVINNAGKLQIASGSIAFDQTKAISNSGILILPENGSESFKINNCAVNNGDVQHINMGNTKNIQINYYKGSNTQSDHTEYIGIYPENALIEIPEVEEYEGCTISMVEDNSDVEVTEEKEGEVPTGQYKLTSEVLDQLPLKAIFKEIKYKLQYKDADTSEGLTTIGNQTSHPDGYTLTELKTISSRGKTTFENIMNDAEAKVLNANRGREFKGWKLDGSDFKLSDVLAEDSWGTLTGKADENNTIIFQVVRGPQQYIIEYRDETGENTITVEPVSTEEADGVNWVCPNDNEKIGIKLTDGGYIPEIKPQNPQTGKTFSGWVYNQGDTLYAFSGEADWASLAKAAADQSNGEKKIIFRAKYDTVKYIIKYINADGDYIGVHFSDSKDNFYSQEVSYGEIYSKEIFAPSVKYYTFDHWEYGEDADAEGKPPYRPTVFLIGGNDVSWTALLTGADKKNVILVKAIYTPITYTIKYKDGDDVATVAPGTLDKYTTSENTTSENTLDSAIPSSFKDGQKPGYRFNRWMYVNILGRRRELIPGRTKWRNLVDGANAKNEIVLWADYGPREYTIKYDTGDGSEVTSTKYTPDDKTGNKTSDNAKISETIPTKTGYYFDNWTYGTGDNAFTDSTTWADLVSSAVAGDGGQKDTINLKANFKPIQYTINYDIGDGSQVASTPYTPDDTTGNKTSDNAKISKETPTKTGYYFEKWTYGTGNNAFIEGTTTWENLVSSAVPSSDGKTGTITLKANFAPIKYDIEYIDDEKSSAGDYKNPKSYTSDETFLLKSNATLDDGSKTGYAFSKWTYGDGENETDFTTDSTTWENLIDSAALNADGKAGKITLKANFEPITYTIKYQTGNSNEFKDEEYTTNEEEGKLLDSIVQLNKNPQKSKYGKGFKAWRYGKNGADEFDPGKTTWKDLVNTAVVDEEKHVIYFKASYKN